MEEHFKHMSRLAQGLVRDTPSKQVTSMLKTMTEIKDKLLQVSLTCKEPFNIM